MSAGPAAGAEQHRRGAHAADHPLRHVGAERAAAQRDVMQDLHEDAAEADHRHRAEHRVAVDAQDAFDAAARSAWPPGCPRSAPPAQPGAARSISGQNRPARPRRRGDVEQDAADLRLVQDVGRQDLHHHREAERSDAAARAASAVAQALFRRGLDACGGEQSLGPGLVRRRGWKGDAAARWAAETGRRRANASPSRPIAWIATTARVGSSNTVKPSAS